MIFLKGIKIKSFIFQLNYMIDNLYTNKFKKILENTNNGKIHSENTKIKISNVWRNLK